MKNPVIVFFAVLMASVAVQAQAPVRKLPSNINHPSLHLFSPYISADGNALLFVSNIGQDGALTVSYTTKNLADWSEPRELPKHINTRLNYLRGFALSADGKKLYITCAKSPVIGGYDIFTSELKGTTWSPMENLMLPINSKQNDGAPSLTPDGNNLYFMRCDKMDQHEAGGCKIFWATRKNGQWQEPIELPEHINKGNSQAPRIMADGETLIFSSDKFAGNKGGMDLYQTRFREGKWTDPIALNFVNTDKNDQFVTADALGRYLIKEARGARNNYELTEFLIPAQLRPQGLTKIEGKITDPNDLPVPAYIAVTDMETGKRVYSSRPLNDGSYFFYLKEGKRYEFSVNPEQSNATFFARTFDLTNERIAQKEKVNVTLKNPTPGDELNLDMVEFKPNSAELESFSTEDLKRLVRLIKANPSMKFEIQVLLKGYRESTDSSDPTLTETREELKTIPVVKDATFLEDSLSSPVDTTLVQAGSTSGISDSTDTTQVETFETVKVIYYHNDRTPKQAQAIVDYLIESGAPATSLSTFVNAIPGESEDDYTLTIKTAIR